MNSSNLEGSISIHSFINVCDSLVTPPGHIPPGASIMPPQVDLEDVVRFTQELDRVWLPVVARESCARKLQADVRTALLSVADRQR